MKIGIIAREENKLFPKLQKEAEKAGHEMKFFSIDAHRMDNFASNSFLEELSDCDVVHYRTGLSKTGVLLLIKHLQEKNIPLVNGEFLKDTFCDAKSFQLAKCDEANIRTPKSICLSSPSFSIVKKTLGLPFIAKKEESSGGRDVHLIRSKKDFDEKCSDTENMLFQEFIPNSGDFRVHVHGNEAPVVYKRIPRESDFRANVHRGGRMEPVKNKALEAKLKQMGKKSAESLSLEMGGIDLLESEKDGKMYFLEANKNPGWRNVFDVTNINLSKKMVEFYEKLQAWKTTE